MRWRAKLFTGLVPFFAAANLFAAGRASHLVLVVWDGMRPDFVTEQNCPTLCELARDGVTFKNHHPVYISTTEVNGTALATGVYPGQSGIVGNKEYRPAINATNRIATESLAAVRAGDKQTDNHYLAYPTVCEILHGKGLRTVIAGAKGVAVLHDRCARTDESLGATLFAGSTLPEALAARLTARLGPVPNAILSGAARDAWTTSALTGPLWEKGVPAFSVLWLSEPDLTQHVLGPGSPSALAAIQSSDRNLARLLAALSTQGLREQTNVIVVSDHGFSTIDRTTGVALVLKGHGFRAYQAFSGQGPSQGDILVVSNGGSVFLYVIGGEPDLVERVAHFLQEQPFCGVVFTRLPVEGAFRLDQAGLDAPTAPDIVLSLRWRPAPNRYGTPGLICQDQAGYIPGQGMHGSLSRFDMHNTCIAAGPDFRKGFADDLPTGNINIAPTILWLLDARPARTPSGRVLREALLDPPDTAPAPPPALESHRIEAAFRGSNFTWRQYLAYSIVNGTRYLDQGNGEQTP